MVRRQPPLFLFYLHVPRTFSVSYLVYDALISGSSVPLFAFGMSYFGGLVAAAYEKSTSA